MIEGSCERKIRSTKENLEKALADQLEQEAPSRQFTIEDVTWYEESDRYDCEFKVRLHRSNGADTTGIIRGTVSKDFTHVSKR